MRRLAAVVSLGMLATGCYEGVAPGGGDEDSFRKMVVNSTELQGPGLVLQGNGLVLQGNGLVLQGNGLVLQGVTMQGNGLVLQGNGLVLQGVELDGTLISATATRDGQSAEVSGLDFVGTEFDLHYESVVNGEAVVEDLVLRIDDIEPSVDQADVFIYHLTYRAKDSDQWLPYCGDDQVGAIPFSGYWDSKADYVENKDVLTFGCTNAVLAKCVLWGYRPWAEVETCEAKKGWGKKKKKHCEDVELRDYHQACTRMARADYCGDGTPHTVTGTQIDIADGLNPQISWRATNWPVEAEWNPDGAYCMNFLLHPELYTYPKCFLDKKGKPKKFKDCGSMKNGRSLLLDAFKAP